MNKPFDLSFRPQDFKKFRLKMNPFPVLAVPNDTPVFIADRESLLDNFRTELSALRNNEDTVITVISGDYGTGKSHLFKYIKYQVNLQLRSSSKPTLAVYIKKIGRNFKDFYSYFIDDVGSEIFTNLALELILSYLTNHKSKVDSYIIDTTKKINEIKRSNIPDFLRNSTFKDLFYDMKQEHRTVHPDLLSALLHLAHPDYFMTSWRWLLGEKLSKEDMKSINVQSTIDDEYIARVILQNIINFIIIQKEMFLVILIDEFEFFTSLPNIARNRFADDLREFIDVNKKKIFLIIASTPSGIHFIKENYTALERRLFTNMQDLGQFETDDVKELIILYLKNARIDESMNTDNIIKDELFPFTDDAIIEIYEKTKGNIAAILVSCRQLISKLQQSNEAIIDQNFIKKYLK